MIPHPDPLVSSIFQGGSLRRIRRRVRDWSRRHPRRLPWRAERDPYRVWISEIMLQQTTVAAVVPYFERFLSRFPTLASLATATEEDVLFAWEGLGYYSRARNLHRTARQLLSDGAGQFPGTVAELTRLPGIGRYTAGAIVSFAFDRPAPILEANTLRLYSRLAGFRGDPHSRAGQNLLWSIAEALVPPVRPGEFNQALMDLGSTVCTPDSPACLQCPLNRDCRAFDEGSIEAIPRLKPRPEITPQVDICVVSWTSGTHRRLLLRRYAAGERWSGLWDVPRLTLLQGDSARPFHESAAPLLTGPQRRSIVDRLATEFGLQVRLDEELKRWKHSVTRFRICLICLEGTVLTPRPSRLAGEWRLVPPAELNGIPLSVSGRKLVQFLQSRESCRK